MEGSDFERRGCTGAMTLAEISKELTTIGTSRACTPLFSSFFQQDRHIGPGLLRNRMGPVGFRHFKHSPQHSCGILLQNTLVGQSCRIRSCGKLLWDTVMQHCCGLSTGFGSNMSRASEVSAAFQLAE